MIKKMFLLVVMIVFVSASMQVVGQGIRFEESREWKQVLKKAKKENKLIFVDCYTSWCGPCKMLASTMFTQKVVGEFYNQNFVNVKFDMEKDTVGRIMKKKFEVRAYPTMLFIDPVTETLVHRISGARSVEWLLEEAQFALEPQNGFAGLTKRYEAGERDMAFMGRYLDALSSAYMKNELNVITMKYINVMPEDQFKTKEAWNIVLKHIDDPLSDPFKRIFADLPFFATLAGEEALVRKLESAVNKSTLDIYRRSLTSGDSFDEERNARLIELLQSLDFAFVPGALANLYSADFLRKKDFRGLLNQMHDAFSYNLFRGNHGPEYFWRCIEALLECDDKSLVQEGIDWLDERCKQTDDIRDKARLLMSKSRLLQKNGDTQGADKAFAEWKVYNGEIKEVID